MIRLLVVDDHPAFRAGLRTMFETAPDLEVVGEASSGTEAIELVRDHRPDVIVMDVQMPDLDGVAATRQIMAEDPNARVLIVTMFENDSTVFAAMRAGARGYVLKGAGYDEMLSSIRTVGAGGAVFGEAVASRLVDWFSGASPRDRDRPFESLSEREHEVLDLLARGCKNAEIAERLFLSDKTVRNHVSAILAKLQVADRTQAAVRAREAGLGLTPGEREQQ